MRKTMLFRRVLLVFALSSLALAQHPMYLDHISYDYSDPNDPKNQYVAHCGFYSTYNVAIDSSWIDNVCGTEPRSRQQFLGNVFSNYYCTGYGGIPTGTGDPNWGDQVTATREVNGSCTSLCCCYDNYSLRDSINRYDNCTDSVNAESPTHYWYFCDPA
jgi:hypothetical protein